MIVLKYRVITIIPAVVSSVAIAALITKRNVFEVVPLLVAGVEHNWFSSFQKVDSSPGHHSDNHEFVTEGRTAEISIKAAYCRDSRE